ncbi:MAG TPA: (4Fe-4S)-binding protein, partial [Candidatus Scatomorpha intestinavium]|nr:(4Fe-4S)-binding protein [Candidatus Scatomorpha intestinavium]
MLKISEEEKKALKGRGIIMTNDGEHFVARVVSSNGVFSNAQLRA